MLKRIWILGFLGKLEKNEILGLLGVPTPWDNNWGTREHPITR